MRQLLKHQVLDALRDSLRDLNTLKLVPADDLEVAALREHLHQTITKIENDGGADSTHNEVAA